FIEHETSAYVTHLRQALAEVSDPVEQLRVYVRQQLSLAPSYHFAPGPDLKQVISRDAIARLRTHVAQVETLLRDILREAIRSGEIPEQDLDAVVPLVHSCLTGRPAPRDEAARATYVATTESFVLRAVGAPEGAVPAGAASVACPAGAGAKARGSANRRCGPPTGTARRYVRPSQVKPLVKNSVWSTRPPQV